MIELLVAALALAAVGAATGLAVRARRRRSASGEAPPALPAARRPEAGEIRPADVLTYVGSTYLVEGVARLDDGAGPSLVVALTSGDEGARWLVVDLGSRKAPVLAEERPRVGAARGLPGMLADGGLELSLVRRVASRAAVEGEGPLPGPGPCEVGRYEGPGDRVCYVLVWSGRELVLGGRTVTVEGLVLMQGGDLVAGSSEPSGPLTP